jgi:hypothetical protein
LRVSPACLLLFSIPRLPLALLHHLPVTWLLRFSITCLCLAVTYVCAYHTANSGCALNLGTVHVEKNTYKKYLPIVTKNANCQ